MATATADSVTTPIVDGGNGTLEDEFINGLVQGGSWLFSGPQELTYSFNLNDDGAGGQGPGGTWAASSQIATAVNQALAAWASVANITFTQITSGTYYFESTADMAFTLSGSDIQNQVDPSAIALGFFPDPDYADLLVERSGYPNPEGDVFLDNFNTVFNSVAVGSAGYWAILHEIGHALGLKHTSDDGGNGKQTFSQLGIAAYDSSQYTAMVPVLSGANAGTPMLLDILAIQAIYGANNNYRTGDDTYDISQNSYGIAIWDAGGSADWLDAFTAAGSTIIDLRAGHFSGYGGALNYSIAYGVTIEHARGSSFSDLITGNNANNTLDGHVGADTMIGGLGNDYYWVDNAGDTIVELPGEGADTVNSSIDYVLGDNLENLIVSGFGTISGTGNSGNNYIKGFNTSNLLSGLGGNDTLEGFGSHDTLVGGSGDDMYFVYYPVTIIQENAGEGVDVVLSDVDYVLSANVETLIMTGTGSVNGSGNSLNNILSGNSGNNILDGAGGVDIIAGGPGNDTYIVDNSGDLVMELGNSGIDSVQSGVSYDLMQAWHVENLTLTGGSAINGSGNWLDNVITGNGAANVLDGNRGDDVLVGGGGNDTLTGGPGSDIFYFDASGAPNADLILDFQGGIDHIHLSLSAFTALGGTGTVISQSVQSALESQISNVSGNAGDSFQDYLKYATDTGHLYYDADGTGAGGLSLVATIYSGGTTPASLGFAPIDDIAIV